MKATARVSATRPTLAAVAARAGVSPSTASLAFSGLGPVAESTRQRVLEAAEYLNYAGPDPRAQSLRRGRSGIIGVVIEDRLSDAFRDPVNIAMLDGVAEETGGVGAGLLLLTEIGGDRANIASAPMDAVILVGCSTRLDESVAILRQRGMPIVAIEAQPMDGVVAIGLDNRAASARAAEHLRDLGHSDVAVIALPVDTPHRARPLPADWEARSTSYTTLQRLQGVQDVFGGVTGFVASGSSIAAGYQAALALLDAAGDVERPTAIIAQSDLLALGVLRAATDLGITVPAELSVVGFDGVDTSLSADLTTLVQPAVAKGRAAGRAVLDLLDGHEPGGADFSAELYIGSTTGPAPRR